MRGGDQRLGQLGGALLDPLLQRFVHLNQGLLGMLVGGDIAVGGDVATARQRPTAQLDHRAVGADTLEQMRRTGLHVVDAFGHMDVHFAGPAFAKLRIPADQISHRHTDMHHAVGVVEQFEVAPVPRHQPHARIDYADALRHILQGGGQQLAVEAPLLRGLVHQRH